jgi:hypothetical protein
MNSSIIHDNICSLIHKKISFLSSGGISKGVESQAPAPILSTSPFKIVGGGLASALGGSFSYSDPIFDRYVVQ